MHGGMLLHFKVRNIEDDDKREASQERSQGLPIWLLTSRMMLEERSEEARLRLAWRAGLKLRREWGEGRLSSRAYQRREGLFDPTTGNGLTICADAELIAQGEWVDSHRPFAYQCPNRKYIHDLASCLNGFSKLRKLRLEV